ncbi:outer membrane protein assembly factor BamD [Dysgonomonas sp. PH5-45]|uniref:outer membrane protein assembly factor BamD n=1 Tax=unclassified Dysgonomonas TaxID=2630389 RepID=UPI00247709AE|nr:MULTISPECIES: outer membrane protein assembly factor BamD [unclassified Dysgonomonas]MDH6354936.1 outer membrane protein assembly factor BamD [Dysgonomonas sp. PH5-45]MDH6387835.1 outer membrane protein assembly factor BamD [Dysgonomonas sp. PH5-37]
MRVKFLYLLVLIIALSSCGEYNKVLKSTDINLKYNYAKKYFDEKKYARTYTLLEDILPYLKNTPKESEGLYLLAQAFFYDKDYPTATQYYIQYYLSYPKGEYAEMARFNAAYAMYLNSSDPRLDQTSTVKALQNFQDFLESYPQSDKAQEAQEYMFGLQEKLAYKELMACQLYYNLGDYMGNNYESCIITAREALKNYAYTKYAEEMQMLILKSRYELAVKSVEERKASRFREVIDEYFNYTNMFPEGQFLKEATKYYQIASTAVEKLQDSSEGA